MSSREVIRNDRTCVAGLFEVDSRAERALQHLKEAGFSEREIGVATVGGPDASEHKSFWDKVSDITGKTDHEEPSETLQESLTRAGMDPSRAHYFDSELSEGKVLISVVADPARAARAEQILVEAGADRGKPATAHVPATAPIHRAENPATRDRKIQLRGEVLRASKERVGTGEVRLHKETVSEKQRVEVPVEREHLVVERAPGTGKEASGPVGQDQEIRIPVSEERVKVEKTPVVNEEVRVRKEPVEEVKHVEGEVRHEELRSEREGKIDVRDRDKDKAA